MAYSIRWRRVVLKRRVSPGRTQSRRPPEFGYGSYKISASWGTLSEKLKNGIKISVGQALLDQNLQNVVLISNPKSKVQFLYQNVYSKTWLLFIHQK